MDRYFVGWNRRGEEPDCVPMGFSFLSEARTFLRDHFRWTAEDEPNPRIANELYAAAIELEIGATAACCSFEIDEYEFWIRSAAMIGVVK